MNFTKKVLKQSGGLIPFLEVKSDRRDGGVVIIKIKMNLNAEEVNVQKVQTLWPLKQTKCL